MKSKDIYIFLDGTGNGITDNYSNVLRMFIQIQHGHRFYGTGIGTDTLSDSLNKKHVSRTSEFIFGTGVVSKLKEAYRFLIDVGSEKVGDPNYRIYLIGFSRGAFTARIFADIIGKVGVLKKEHRNLVDTAFDLYFDGSRKHLRDSFMYAFSRYAPVSFLGCFDTVKSVFLNGRKYKDNVLSDNIIKAYHLIAKNEYRLGYNIVHMKGNGFTKISHEWLRGSHTDIGGGGAGDVTLSNYALLKMWDELRKAGAPLVPAKNLMIEVNQYAPIYNSRTWGWRLLPKRKRSHLV